MKCCCCKKEILDNHIHAPKKTVKYWWHLECYRGYSGYTKENELRYAKETECELKSATEEKELFEYICNRYNVFLSKYEFMKLANIKNGSFKTKQYPRGVGAISYSRLLILFKDMETYLSNINMNFKDNSSKFNYHLVVVINQYPKYIENQKKQEKIKDSIKPVSIPEEILHKKREDKSQEFDVTQFAF